MGAGGSELGLGCGTGVLAQSQGLWEGLLGQLVINKNILEAGLCGWDGSRLCSSMLVFVARPL